MSKNQNKRNLARGKWSLTLLILGLTILWVPAQRSNAQADGEAFDPTLDRRGEIRHPDAAEQWHLHRRPAGLSGGAGIGRHLPGADLFGPLPAGVNNCQRGNDLVHSHHSPALVIAQPDGDLPRCRYDE